MLDNEYGGAMLAINKQFGVTLIELLVGILIVGILTALAAPNFQVWIQQQRTRTAAEAILNGLQLARSTAVSNNGQAAFVLCQYPTSTWVVVAASAAAPAPNSTACGGAGPAGYVIVQERGSQEGTSASVVTTDTATHTITFNSMGRTVTPTNPIDGSAPFSQITVDPAGPRPLQINAGAGGNIRMCDPTLSNGTAAQKADPRAC